MEDLLLNNSHLWQGWGWWWWWCMVDSKVPIEKNWDLAIGEDSQDPGENEKIWQMDGHVPKTGFYPLPCGNWSKSALNTEHEAHEGHWSKMLNHTQIPSIESERSIVPWSSLGYPPRNAWGTKKKCKKWILWWHMLDDFSIPQFSSSPGPLGSADVFDAHDGAEAAAAQHLSNSSLESFPGCGPWG